MKLDKLIICGLPKSFDVWESLDYLDSLPEDHVPEDIKYDAYPMECDEDKGEEGQVIFKYEESASGVYVTYNTVTQNMELELSPWAVEADVRLYVDYVNAILSKHKRARLFEKYAPLAGLTEKDAEVMVDERKKLVQKMLATTKGFTMEGINESYTVYPSRLPKLPSEDILISELQRAFVARQWRE